MSTDAAHSLGDALGCHLGERPGGSAAVQAAEPVLVEERLHALQVGAPHPLDVSWRLVQDYLLEVLGTLGIDPVVAEELTSLPGAEEVSALLELHTRAQSGDWDLVVVDCAPTAETLRLLALPEALAWHLHRLLPAQRGLLRALRPAAAAAAGVPLPSAEVAGTVAGWSRRMREVQSLLSGPAASVRIVLTPERVVIAEARRTWTSLSLFGFVVDGVVVNRVIPPARGPRGDAWRRAWTSAQDAGLREVADSFAGMPVVQVPYLAGEPVGPQALDAFAAAVTAEGVPPPAGDPFRVLGAVAPEGLRVRRHGAGYRLSLPLPLVAADEVDLKRRDTELLVAVGDHRRVLTLPAALQRCVVRGARVKDGTLVVTFEPDPSLWPATPDRAGNAGSLESAASSAASDDGVPADGRRRGA
jgi:arsenite/tail-anchored protein-transporting ATPase